ncbi:hypothetical protein CIB84_017448 [Bambusicola thoracicus]|uniref:Uncharacterized protein n=1 Tax=Bambusicola thoracicus TaxID=9083 RepID=A0A2P4S406_BAMTH|nr:hypothetical protein CIB84_017448 [Bambusicola thoracicus]
MRKRGRKSFWRELICRLQDFLQQQVPAHAEDLPLPCAPTLSPSPWLDGNAGAWKKRNQQQRSCLQIRE